MVLTWDMTYPFLLSPLALVQDLSSRVTLCSFGFRVLFWAMIALVVALDTAWRLCVLGN